jgi:hypothetical protein
MSQLLSAAFTAQGIDEPNRAGVLAIGGIPYFHALHNSGSTPGKLRIMREKRS